MQKAKLVLAVIFLFWAFLYMAAEDQKEESDILYDRYLAQEPRPVL